MILYRALEDRVKAAPFRLIESCVVSGLASPVRAQPAFALLGARVIIITISTSKAAIKEQRNKVVKKSQAFHSIQRIAVLRCLALPCRDSIFSKLLFYLLVKANPLFVRYCSCVVVTVPSQPNVSTAACMSS